MAQKINRCVSMILSCAFAFTILLGIPVKAEKMETKKAATKRPFEASAIVSIKNSQQVYSLMSKNRWFLDFRQSALYDGMLYDLYPSLFSLPDEFSVGKETNWSGRLIDYVYETILKNRPTQIYFYQQRELSSPWGIAVNGITSAEAKVIEQLLKLFKVGDDKTIDLSENDSGKVSLIEIKAQKWAVKKDGNCLNIGKDPRVVLHMSRNCKTLKMSSDLDIDVNLSLIFPSLISIREKVVGIDKSMKLAFNWNQADNRFDLAPISLGVSKENIFVSRKVANDLLKAIPSDSHFFVIGNIRVWNGSMSVETVKSFLASKKRQKDFQKQAAAVLIQLPIKAGDRLKTETALIFESGNVDQKQLDSISELFDSNFAEVYSRPVCGKAVVVSRSQELVQKIQNVCDRKSPSILDRKELKAADLASQDSSLSFFADMGKWASGKIEAGYLSKIKEKKWPTTLPPELSASQSLLEQLPKYLVKGAAKDQNIILK